jgi:hypothetical protein
MTVGALVNLSCHAYVNPSQVAITFARPANCTSIKFVMTPTSLVEPSITKTYTIQNIYPVGGSITYMFTGLIAGKKYYLTGTPYNGTTAGTPRIYYNSNAIPINSVVMPSGTTATSTVTNLPKSSGVTNVVPQVTPNTPAGTTTNNGSTSTSQSAGPNTPNPQTQSTTPKPSFLNNPNRIQYKVGPLQTNQTYEIKVRAVATQSDGTIVHSEDSIALIVNTPTTAPSGSNFLNSNLTTDTALSGGAIYAGDFPINVGSLDVVNGSTSGTGVVLNRTGLAGFNAGVKEFYIDASTGQAYFAGTVTAGTVIIGSNINNTGKTGLYIDAANYWYSDGSFSATSSDIAGALTNKAIDNPLTPPDAVTSITSSWSGDTLSIGWSFNANAANNSFAKNFILSLTASGTTKEIIVPISQTSYALTLTQNRSLFGLAQTSFSISIKTEDSFGNKSTASTSSGAAYVNPLPTPTISVAAVNNGYSVSYTTPTSLSFSSISIEEYESSASTEPTGVTYSTTYIGSLNPSVVIVPNTNKRWVKARFVSQIGSYTAYSTAYAVTPNNPVSVDLVPPNEVTAVTGSWNGDNIDISYTLPSTDPASRVQIQLTAPNSLVGYFYRFPDGLGTSQTTTIYKKDLYDQFGEHYSSYSGLLKSIDTSDNRSSGVSFSVAARANPLTSITPTFTSVALSNAYSITTTFPTGATFFEVYAKHTAWSGNPTDDTYLVYAGASPAVVVDTNYTTVYIKIRYYDDFGNTSNYSAQGTITPLDPGSITSFENPISFGTNAVIYAGNSATSGTRTLFKTGGIFAYDATNTTPSTQIISDASAGSPTFITTQATIAGWSIDSSKIEKLTSANYAGISSGSSYSFYAGSSVTGGDSSANFYVTPAGAVQAKNITITGGSLNVADNFVVTTSGNLTANGTLSLGGSGSIGGNLSITGSLYKGTLSAGSLSGAGYILNSSGLTFNSSSINGITTIDATTGLFTTTSANIGGWSIDSSTIKKTSGSNYIQLDSANTRLGVFNGSSYSAGVNMPTASSSVVFWAGSGGEASTGNNFYVTAAGALYASNATISGNITANAIASGTSISGATGTFTGTLSGNTITGASISGGSITGVTITGGTITSTGYAADSTYGSLTISGSMIEHTSSFTVNAGGGYFYLTNGGDVILGDGNVTGDLQFRIQRTEVSGIGYLFARGYTFAGLRDDDTMKDPYKTTNDSTSLGATVHVNDNNALRRGRTLHQGAQTSATNLNNIYLGETGDLYFSTA